MSFVTSFTKRTFGSALVLKGAGCVCAHSRVAHCICIGGILWVMGGLILAQGVTEFAGVLGEPVGGVRGAL